MNTSALDSSRRLLSLLALSASLVLAAACSNSDSPDEEKTVDPVEQPQEGDNQVPSEQTPTDQNPGTDPGVDPNRTPDVCNPFEQAGCSGETSKCGMNGNRYGCQAPGSAQQGEPCERTQAGDTCAAGLICIGKDEDAACQRFCDQAKGEAACPADQVCETKFVWNRGPPFGEVFHVCAPKGDQCDPLTQDGCLNPEDACYVTPSGAKCQRPKDPAVAIGGACEFSNDCQKGSTCFSTTGNTFACSAYCTPAPAEGEEAPENPVVCAAGTTCTPITGTKFGACG